ncbi:hypothetical protein AGMMS49938_07650 [Fibrobacterales bacterium]|nr:hypothetical protein AGMMS49938_07650 [Fibrobacterales bacterium]
MKFVVSFFSGLGIGALLGPAVYILAVVFEFLACFITCQNASTFFSLCNCLHARGDKYAVPQEFWTSSTFMSILIFCTIAGAIIGAVCGMVMQIQTNEKVREENEQNMKEAAERDIEKKRKADLEQRQENANQFKYNANVMINECRENSKNCNDTINSFSFTPEEVILFQSDLWLAIHKSIVVKPKELQESIDKLEYIEWKIREHFIDCIDITKGYKDILEDIISKSQKIGEGKSELSQNEKMEYEDELRKLLSVSKSKYEELNKVISDNPIFSEYKNLMQEQKELASSIQQKL